MQESNKEKNANLERCIIDNNVSDNIKSQNVVSGSIKFDDNSLNISKKKTNVIIIVAMAMAIVLIITIIVFISDKQNQSNDNSSSIMETKGKVKNDNYLDNGVTLYLYRNFFSEDNSYTYKILGEDELESESSSWKQYDVFRCNGQCISIYTNQSTYYILDGDESLYLLDQDDGKIKKTIFVKDIETFDNDLVVKKFMLDSENYYYGNYKGMIDIHYTFNEYTNILLDFLDSLRENQYYFSSSEDLIDRGLYAFFVGDYLEYTKMEYTIYDKQEELYTDNVGGFVYDMNFYIEDQLYVIWIDVGIDYAYCAKFNDKFEIVKKDTPK